MFTSHTFSFHIFLHIFSDFKFHFPLSAILKLISFSSSHHFISFFFAGLKLGVYKLKSNAGPFFNNFLVATRKVQPQVSWFADWGVTGKAPLQSAKEECQIGRQGC